MTVAPTPTAAAPEVPAEPTRPGLLRHIVRHDKQAAVGIVVLLLFIGMAVFAPLIEPYGVHAQTGQVYEEPSGQHWLGTNDGGVDVLSLVIHGSRVSLLVGFFAALVAMVIGGTIGVLAGFYGGRLDSALSRITDIFLVLPDLPLIVVFAALFGRSLRNIIIIIGIIYWTSTMRLIRAQVRSIRERVYVQRARSIGASNRRLIIRHVVPQVMPLLVANSVLMIAYAIFLETFVTFLGLGDPSAISWGSMIEDAFRGQAVLNDAWWALVPPGLCVTIVILAFTLVGQSIEDSLNPRLKVGHLSVRRFRVRPRPGKRVVDE